MMNLKINALEACACAVLGTIIGKQLPMIETGQYVFSILIVISFIQKPYVLYQRLLGE